MSLHTQKLAPFLLMTGLGGHLSLQVLLLRQRYCWQLQGLLSASASRLGHRPGKSLKNYD